MNRITSFTLLLSALLMCGCSKNDDDFKNEETFTVNGVTFKMIGVKGGTFDMGATAEQSDVAEEWEKPVHSVSLSNYYIGQTEVTQKLWEAVMDDNPSFFMDDNLPVDSVSWEDVQSFTAKLNVLTGRTFRLPTEAEWEYAARGGSQSRGTKYSGSNTLDEVAWYVGNSSKTTHDVGALAPNELGLYDMSGNLWEWCQDWYGEYSSSAQTNPTGPESGEYRVLRGGGWNDEPADCRVSYRGIDPPEVIGIGTGFRLVLVP